MKHYGDIKSLSGYELPVVDVITGGSPCVDLSVAGKRAGLEGERSGLFMEQVRIVKEMRDNDRRTGRTAYMVRPRYMVWENVPGAFSSNGGKDFQIVLTEIVRIVDPQCPDVPMPEKGGWKHSGCLYDELGRWSIAWRLHDAQFWGVPQRRKRIALVADFGGMSAPEILFERQGLSRDLEPGGTERKETAGSAGSRAENSGRGAYCLQGNGIDRADTAGCNGRGWTEDVSYTLNTIDRPAVLPFDTTQITSPGNYSSPKPGDPCHPIAESAHPPAIVAGFKGGQSTGGIGYEEEKAPTLSGNPSALEPTVFDARGNGDGRLVPTITGDHENRITDYTAVCIGNGQAHMASHITKEVSRTLNCMHDQLAVIVFDKEMYNYGEGFTGEPQARKEEVAPTVRADSHPSSVCNANIVRRLTPMECERLQVFPDGWTDIGDWVDSKGKKHQPSDSARYKALGNSIALPFWFWLLRRISAQYERPATLGSLFDGIGGFPLCWERCNGKGTAVWASEIEEFCIAVTRKHFPEGEEN